MIDLILLATLLDGPKHGYRLKKEAGLIFGQENLHNNLVYPLLRRYSSQGWVTKKSESGKRGQTRLVYSLTPAGRRALIEQLSRFDEKDARSAEAFFARVGLFPVLEPAVREQILSMRQQALTERERRLATLSQEMDLGTYGTEVVTFLLQQMRHEMDWIARLRRLGQRRPADRKSRTARPSQ